MASGRKGMGDHKHGTSGHAGHSPRFKQNRERESNQELAAEQTKTSRRRSVGLTHSSVSEAGKAFKPR